MKILAIETSCDETAIAIVEASADEKDAHFRVLGNALLSQIEIHREYGGVFPMLAKREHAKNLVPILTAALEEAELLHEDTQIVTEETRARISEILARESGLEEQFFAFITENEIPEIDAIAVTAGPGLEPALWVGINFAKALGIAWNKPLVAVNHMEGHILAALASREDAASPWRESGGAPNSPTESDLVISNIQLPVLALLISGGHTELVLSREWLSYEYVGQTRDDAVGEAFDKVARMLGLPYPGGPEISRLAEEARSMEEKNPYTLPRPMIDSETGDLSFAGLKTAVLYLLKNNPEVNETDKKHIAHEFENAVADVLWSKTSKALAKTGAKTFVIGGGVSANTHIRRVFEERMAQEHPEVALHVPAATLTTDNAIMIGLAGFYHARKGDFANPETLRANGNLSLV